MSTNRPAPQESAPASFYRLLRRGPFARYMGGETISMTGTWMQVFAQNWVLTTLSLEATKLGWMVFAGGIPTLLLAMIGGSLADRYDKRWILLTALSIQLCLAVLVGWLVQSHQIAIWHLYAVTALLGVVTAFEMPTVSAFIPELVSRDDISRALAIDRAIFHFTRMIGPAVAGYLVGKLGEPLAYYVNAATFLALAAAILTIGPRPKGSQAEEQERKGPMSAGFEFVRHDSPTRAMVLLMGAAALFASPFFMVTMPVYARGVLGLDARGMGWLMAFSGVGSLCGAVSLLFVRHGHRATFLKCAVASAVAGLLGLALAQTFEIATVSIILMTLGLSSGFGTAHIVIQERSPDAIRGRVSAVASLAFFGVMPFAGLAVAAFADHIGLRRAMMLGAIGYAAAGAVLLFGRKQLAAAPRD
ncbi:MAG TPA: MFS transporter [Chthoniobacteraceae bacterium]|nr:MFS transporter [Chthoniobacteraceae bacterium]